MAVAIKVENLSKIYRLGEIGTGTVSRDIERWVRTKVMRQEDPFLRIGESNDRSTKGKSDIVYSLQDINFEIEQGDAVGIMGRNGAGKSTLLKILSRVTAPTKGRISVKGRIASLLEVGTGFHPDLTGRENIYLNGSMLGMRKKEIDRRLDEIIDFSGVERYIDTPVKRYSSGMYVRLAFAVAAHLESEILIVDEVLAVGDAEFQQKCLGKMGDVSKGEGRTLLFVSHNMEAIRRVCNDGLFLGFGKIISHDKNISKVIDAYLINNEIIQSCNEVHNKNLDIYIKISKIEQSLIYLSFEFKSKAENLISEFCILIYSPSGIRIGIIDFRNIFNGSLSLKNNEVRNVNISFNLSGFVTSNYYIGFWLLDTYTAKDYLSLIKVYHENVSQHRYNYPSDNKGIHEIPYNILDANG